MFEERTKILNFESFLILICSSKLSEFFPPRPEAKQQLQQFEGGTSAVELTSLFIQFNITF